MSTVLVPLGNNVLIELILTKETGKISLPDETKKEMAFQAPRGYVRAVGPGKLLKNGTRGAMDVKVGDLVLLRKCQPEKTDPKNETMVIVDQQFVMGAVTEV